MSPGTGPVLAVTGHRPKDLFGYNMSDIKYLKIQDKIRQAVLDLKPPEFYTGMALGIDQLAAMAVLDAKRYVGFQVILHAALPCRNQDASWPGPSKAMYKRILGQCDRITLVTNQPYSPQAMHARNAFMCRHAGALIAVWDDNKTKGGTYACIQAMQRLGKPVLHIDPSNPDNIKLLERIV